MLRDHPIRTKRTPMKLAALVAVAAAAVSYVPEASAQRHGGGGPGFHGGGHGYQGGHGYGGRGYGGGGGRWVHQGHGGRIGWWWVAGGLWYLTPPVYVNAYPTYSTYPAYSTYTVEVAPPLAISGDAPLPAPPQTWYYCDASRAYYPYVSSCAAGWKAVPATPPDLSSRPPTAP